MLINIVYLIQKHFYFDAFRYIIWYIFYYLDVFLMLIEEPFFMNRKIENPIFIPGILANAWCIIPPDIIVISVIKCVCIKIIVAEKNPKKIYNEVKKIFLTSLYIFCK